MERREPRKDRLLKLVDDEELDPDLSGEELVDEMVVDATPRDLARLLDEFPDDPLFVLPVFEQFLARGSGWPGPLKGQLADALDACGYGDEAQVVRDR